ncbi:MAG TPA: MliC family protein [Reyranella sp.]|jgi:membrane-bound inhibitor of C-type lysozyme|nr:MliC family protein [Reyranella sp.]
MGRLSIALMAIALPPMLALSACVPQDRLATSWTPIARPAPDDMTPAGIAYLCDGRKEVSVVYAKNRASVTFDNKTWRMEYQAAADGFRYSDTTAEWTGRDDLAALREMAGANKPLAFNCRPTRRTI